MVSRVPFSACLTCPDRARNATGRSRCRSGRSGGATPNADCGRTHGDARTALSVATPRCDPGRSHTDDPRPVPAGRRPCPAGLFRPGAAAGLCAHGCQTVNRTFRRSSRNRAPMWQTRGETWVNLPPVWCVPGIGNACCRATALEPGCCPRQLGFVQGLVCCLAASTARIAGRSAGRRVRQDPRKPGHASWRVFRRAPRRVCRDSPFGADASRPPWVDRTRRHGRMGGFVRQPVATAHVPPCLPFG